MLVIKYSNHNFHILKPEDESLIIDLKFDPHLKFFFTSEFIKRQIVSSGLKVIYNRIVGLFPMGDMDTLVIPLKGMKISNYNDIAAFVSIMLKYYHYRASNEKVQVGMSRADTLRISDIIPQEDLAMGLIHALEKIPDFPLRTIKKINGSSRVIKGKLKIASLIMKKYTRPTIPLESSFQKVTLNHNENILIKTALEKLMESNLFLPDSLEKRMAFFHKQLVSVNTSSNPYSDLIFTEPTCKLTEIAINFSKTILFKKSFFGVKDFLDIRLPAFKNDYLLYEDMVRDTFHKVISKARKESIEVSSSSSMTFNPDLVIDSNDTIYVLDMKYKHLFTNEHGSQNKPDIYQILSHSMSYSGVKSVGLVYPKWSDQSSNHKILVLDKIFPPKNVVAMWINIDDLFGYVSKHYNSPKLEAQVLELMSCLIEKNKDDSQKKLTS